MPALLRSTTLLLALALSLAGPAVAGEAPPRRDLSGTWSFDEDLTAKLREEARRNRESGGGLGMGGMGRRRGSGGGPPEGGPRGAGRERGGALERPGMPSFQEALNQLTITATGDTLTITDKAGRQRTVRTDGKKTLDEAAPGGPVELRAEWTAGGNLAVEVKPKKGPKRTEIYAVSTDRQHLFLTITTGDGDHGMKFIRAYDAVPVAAAASAPSPGG